MQHDLGHEGPHLGLGDPRAAEQEPAPPPQQRCHVLWPGGREVPQQQAGGELADLRTHSGDTPVNQSLLRLTAQGGGEEGRSYLIGGVLQTANQSEQLGPAEEVPLLPLSGPVDQT